MSKQSLAYFITPHGFGHATRAAAVMGSIQRVATGQGRPAIRYEIFTRVPRWLFEQSLEEPFGYHELQTDIGLAQRDALHEDIPETLRQLDAFLPFDSSKVAHLAQQVHDLNCEMVLCDIAPLGIAVASAVGVPSVLVENFTWDWIYAGYVAGEPRLQRHIDTLRQVFHSATCHIQTEPVCDYTPSNLLSAPVSRAPRVPAARIREQLGVGAGQKLVLITMGGLSGTDAHTFVDQLSAQRGITFIIPGGSEALHSEGNVIVLPYHSSYFHPDLVNAVDALVGKTGYSTVAEAYHAGVPYGYVPREHFPESEVMEAYIQTNMRGLCFAEAEFRSGAWLKRLPELLALGRITRSGPNGARQVAEFLLNRNNAPHMNTDKRR
jgi:hypothetical protein